MREERDREGEMEGDGQGCARKKEVREEEEEKEQPQRSMGVCYLFTAYHLCVTFLSGCNPLLRKASELCNFYKC